MVVSWFILYSLCVQEREILQLKERERETIMEQLDRNQEQLERERREKERGQQELVRQTQLCFITMLIVLNQSFFLQLFNRRELAQAQSTNETQQQELVRYYMSMFTTVVYTSNT